MDGGARQRLHVPGSILHGRTIWTAYLIKRAVNRENRRDAEQAGNPIPEELFFDQITNLFQLASIKTITGVPYSEDRNPGNYYFWDVASVLRAGDLTGLVNLKILGFYGLDVLEAGAFDSLTNLEILHIYIRGVRDFPAGIFDQLTNLKELHLGSHPRYNFYGSRTNAFLPVNALDRLVNLESLGLDHNGIDYERNFDHLVNLKKIDFRQWPPLSHQWPRPDSERIYGVVSLPPSVRTIGDYRTVYEIQEPVLSPPVNVGGGYVFPALSPSPQPTVEVGQRSSDLRFTSTSLSLAEGESATYQVRATADPARDMVVNLATAHSGITVNPSRITYYSHNWQTFQTVTVTASSDAADTDEQASIQHSIPASNGFVANNNAGIVSVTLAHTVVEEEEPERQVVQQVNVPPTDYDQDDDGLIEVSNLAQLNAIRWDLNGDGQPDKEEFADDYSLAFPSAIDNPKAQGYELTDDLDFGDNPTSWESIGVFSNPFQAVFEGNDHTIHNLFQARAEVARFINQPSGLFGAIGNRGQVVNLGLEGVQIKGVNWVGALVGLNQGSIGACSAVGKVEGVHGVGGLVGQNFGTITLSVAEAEVKGVSGVGDLVGIDTTAR